MRCDGAFPGGHDDPERDDGEEESGAHVQYDQTEQGFLSIRL
jgi:hypothetical protein